MNVHYEAGAAQPSRPPLRWRSAAPRRRRRASRSRASPMPRRGTSSNTGGGSVKSLVSGSNSTSRIIIRGVEDLGGGLSAGFHLEHGILLDTGTAVSATQFWDRRSTVSLDERRLGRAARSAATTCRAT